MKLYKPQKTNIKHNTAQPIYQRKTPIPIKSKQIIKPMPTNDQKQLSIIIRYSNRSTHRYRNLKLLIEYLQTTPNIEIILSVMEKDIPNELINQKTIKTYSPQPFESSKANNIGANTANTNILVFQDADIIFHNKYYQMIIEQIKNGYESIRIGQTCVNLGELVTHQLATREIKLNELLSRPTNDSIRDAPGGCSAITKEAFIKIGGYCELFQKYGWEDCYYRIKQQVLTKHTNLNACMYHLWHEENYQAGYQTENAHLYNDLIATNNTDCIHHSNRDRKYLELHYENLK